MVFSLICKLLVRNGIAKTFLHLCWSLMIVLSNNRTFLLFLDKVIKPSVLLVMINIRKGHLIYNFWVLFLLTSLVFLLVNLVLTSVSNYIVNMLVLKSRFASAFHWLRSSRLLDSLKTIICQLLGLSDITRSFLLSTVDVRLSKHKVLLWLGFSCIH